MDFAIGLGENSHGREQLRLLLLSLLFKIKFNYNFYNNRCFVTVTCNYYNSIQGYKFNVVVKYASARTFNPRAEIGYFRPATQAWKVEFSMAML